MSENINKGRLLALISELLDGELDEAARDELNALLKASPEARAFYAQRMELHASLHRQAEANPASRDRLRPKPQQHFTRGNLIACAAIFVGLLIFTVAFVRIAQPDPTFATIETVQSARWESSDHGISEGARIGVGTIRLSKGLATLHFDSGAKITVEGPTEIELIDAMRCNLPSGVLEATIPPLPTAS